MAVRQLTSFDPEGGSAQDILCWAVDRFGTGLATSSSFQMQSLPLLHMLGRLAPHVPVIFLDTGFHFPETLAFRDRLVAEWGLNLRVVRREPEPGEHRHRILDLPQIDPDLCCHMHKVEPMQRAMRDYRAWLSGIRRDQSQTRASIRTIEAGSDGLTRIHPFARWTGHDVSQYIARHDLPEHPLLAKGYVSIGCAPCTRPVQIGQTERAGRWSGRAKTECGLHTTLRPGSPAAES